MNDPSRAHGERSAAGTQLSVRNLRVGFGRGRHRVQAVDGVDLDVAAGESVGLVGESGCGKTTTGRAILRLGPLDGGSVCFEGKDIVGAGRGELRRLRARVQMVFQDPVGSLNPRLSAGRMLQEVLSVHGSRDAAARRARAAELLEAVGLDASYADRYPHEFSGGQRQRLGLARALAVQPRLIIADEPVSALDVSVQVQILNLMKDVQKAFDLSYLFVAHDLAVVRYVCRRLYVMYRGRVVEAGPVDAVYDRPAHPYTRALLRAVPALDTAWSPAAPGPVEDEGAAAPVVRGGCPYYPRCSSGVEACRGTRPALVEVGLGHRCACVLAGRAGR